MIFEITIQDEQGTSISKPLRIHAADWFSALREGLPKMGEVIDFNEVDVKILEDEQSAVIRDPEHQRKILLLVVQPQEEEQITPPQNKFEELTHIRFETKEVPIQPSIRSETFSLDGAYVSGATTDFLTEAFMKVGDLHGHFGNDLQAAMEHLFAMLKKATKAIGGGLLLSDINDPNAPLQFIYSMGEHEALLHEVQIPSGQGCIGHCAQYSTQLNIEDLARDTRFPNDTLTEIGLPAGPILCIPIEHYQRLVGVLVLYRARNAAPFTQGESNIFSYLSGAIAEYLNQIGNIE